MCSSFINETLLDTSLHLVIVHLDINFYVQLSILEGTKKPN